MTNPLDDLVPDFTVFGAEFTSLWQKIGGGIWAIGILVAIFYLGRGILAMGRSRGSGHPQEYKDAKTEALWGGISFGGLVALATIVTVIMNVLQ